MNGKKRKIRENKNGIGQNKKNLNTISLTVTSLIEF
jgi:hypothetical protein